MAVRGHPEPLYTVPAQCDPELSHHSNPQRMLSHGILSQNSVPKSVPSLSRLGELLNTQKNVHAGGPGGPPGVPGGPPSHPAQSGGWGVGLGGPGCATPSGMLVRCRQHPNAPGGTPGPPLGVQAALSRQCQGTPLEPRERPPLRAAGGRPPGGCRVGAPTPLGYRVLPPVRPGTPPPSGGSSCSTPARVENVSQFTRPPHPPGLLHRSRAEEAERGEPPATRGNAVPEARITLWAGEDRRTPAPMRGPSLPSGRLCRPPGEGSDAAQSDTVGGAPDPPLGVDPRGVSGGGPGGPKKCRLRTPLRCKAQGGWGGSAHCPDPTAQSVVRVS